MDRRQPEVHIKWSEYCGFKVCLSCIIVVNKKIFELVIN